MTEFDDALDSNPDQIYNLYILSIGMLPFLILLISFVVILCARKIEDYYLQRSIVFMIASMVLRICMCLIVLIIFIDADDSGTSWLLFELKASIVQFTLPYYCFLLVSTSLLFSAHTFYVSLRQLLFPELKQIDDDYQPVKKIVPLNSRTRFLCLQSLICILVLTFTITAFSNHNKQEVETFSSFSRALLWICEISLYLIQVVVLFGGVFVFVRLRRLSKSKPKCDLCPMDGRSCIECSNIETVLAERLKTIYKVLSFFLSIQTCNFLLYTSQRAVNLFHLDHDKSIFNIEPVVLLLQLALEILMISGMLAIICNAQKKRFGAADSSQVSTGAAAAATTGSITSLDDFVREGTAPESQLLEPVERKQSLLAIQKDGQKGDTTEDDESDSGSVGNLIGDQRRLQALLRLTTEVGDDIDHRSQSLIKSANATPRQKMFDDDELEDKDLFD